MLNFRISNRKAFCLLLCNLYLQREGYGPCWSWPCCQATAGNYKTVSYDVLPCAVRVVLGRSRPSDMVLPELEHKRALEFPERPREGHRHFKLQHKPKLRYDRVLCNVEQLQIKGYGEVWLASSQRWGVELLTLTAGPGERLVTHRGELYIFAGHVNTWEHPCDERRFLPFQNTCLTPHRLLYIPMSSLKYFFFFFTYNWQDVSSQTGKMSLKCSFLRYNHRGQISL